MLNYSLHENLLTERTDDYAAQAHASAVYTREQFISLMLQRGTLVTKTDIVAVLNNIEETVAYIIENGGQLNLPLFNTSFSISGVFEGAVDSFDPNRHKLHVNLHKGTLVRDAEKLVKVAKVNTPSPQPQILEVRDSVSGEVDTALTSGGVVEINGINIKISGDEHVCGLFFVDEGNNEIKAVTLVSNKPATVFAIIPELPHEDYRVKIVTQYSGHRDLREPKTTVFNRVLKVL
ncbi:MAG: DUF4469 domain-containing protein [Prevotellaceae bacterium]|jgi:hypothetical protein|nr:DUF4469 domain-containing protein [Prevotellaceae bacterium]